MAADKPDIREVWRSEVISIGVLKKLRAFAKEHLKGNLKIIKRTEVGSYMEMSQAQFVENSVKEKIYSDAIDSNR
jgi:hypothetical protein